MYVLSCKHLSAIGIVCAVILASFRASDAADEISTWDGGIGNWSDAARWDSVDFPNNGNGGLTYDAIVNSGAVTLDADIVIETLSLSGGVIDGDFDLTLTGVSSWTGGQQGGTGTTRVSAGATLDITGNLTLRRDLENSGIVNFAPSAMNFDSASGGDITFTTSTLAVVC